MNKRQRKPVPAVPVAHIYAQGSWHDAAFIVGNRAYLRWLRKAIDQALSTPGNGSAPAFASDGEEYNTVVVLYDYQLGPNWDRLALPYTDECAKERRQKGYYLDPLHLCLERGIVP